ncbi:MAG: hypothetical protein KGL54_07455 [Sphingomonadales bacterium]|nr:hypothetical protein [Sphingomonadales bacterium]
MNYRMSRPMVARVALGAACANPALAEEAAASDDGGLTEITVEHRRDRVPLPG